MVECIYQNDSSRMVIMKCIGSSQFYLEKVIMPSEIFLFNAPKEARLEIWRMSISVWNLAQKLFIFMSLVNVPQMTV